MQRDFHRGLSIQSDDVTIRCVATIAWCRYELRGEGGYYLAGIEFAQVDADAVEHFCLEHADEAGAPSA